MPTLPPNFQPQDSPQQKQAAQEYTPQEYTPQEVATLCGLSRRRVYDWLSWGWLRGHRRGGRWVVTAADWDFFAYSCRGARGRLMPSLHDWPPLWASRPPDAAVRQVRVASFQKL